LFPAISHATCTLLFNGKTDETDLTDLNGSFETIRSNPLNPFHPFCYPVLILIRMGNCILFALISHIDFESGFQAMMGRII
jgi:hypothetical protein